MPTILRSIAEAREVLGEWRKQHPESRLALVPTMGALHDGHLSLVRVARERADAVVVSVFVNPLQFGPDEDFDRYPRTFDADVAALAGEGVEYVFAPSADDMYPSGASDSAGLAGGGTHVAGGAAASVLDGAHRPGHFDGVLTVVAKLFNILRPDAAVFGQKDAQQLFVVRQMAADLNLGVEVVGAPIVREADGLALSSRNVYLSSTEREAALALSRALEAAGATASRGGSVGEVVAAASEVIAGQAGVVPDYVEAVDPATFAPPADGYRGDLLVLLAARVGATRLIDNAVVAVGGADAGAGHAGSPGGEVATNARGTIV